jgi:predicted transcriptional regulator
MSTLSVDISSPNPLGLNRPKPGNISMADMRSEHIRAARAWLGWQQVELAARSKVSLSTVRDFEKGRHTPIANNIAAMQKAIEDAGVRFLLRDGVVVGIVRADAASGPFD